MLRGQMRWAWAAHVFCALAASASAQGAGAIPTEAYVVREAPVEGLRLPAPELPDLAGYTRAAVEARIGADTPATVSLRRILRQPAFKEFTGSDGRLVEWARRQPSVPRAIFVENGYMTPAMLAERVESRWFEQTSPGVYLLRLPLVVGHDATLHIDPQTRDFRMSEEGGAFLVNDGRLFVIGTRLIAWREKEDAPATFRDGSQFRPFLLSWGGTETYIVDSTVASLGYAASKSYGVSISQYSPSIVRAMDRGHPTGWLIDSTFEDNWYGFYCYEADDVVIVGNVYRDNIVYGIDPHDRSRRLIIAENEAYGTVKKHGIIVSREVNDSWIFRNRAHHNGLSGIVIDRSSVRNIVADNTSFANGSDGITIYESSDNLLWRNVAIANDRHGIRVRNSVRVRLQDNRAVANGSAGVYGHIKDLHGTDRDLVLDPFEPVVSLVVVGGQLVHNGSGPVRIDQPLSLELYDVDLLAPTRIGGLGLPGVLGRHQHRLLDLLVRQRRPVIIEPAQGGGRDT
ncbi:MAG: mannuronan 5-epimerase AlgG [Pseudomonadota bacterium]|nr:mannuronan 5-epimerase AlgG [Pseudomonadota bacterium]